MKTNLKNYIYIYLYIYTHTHIHTHYVGFPDGASGKEHACQCRRQKRCGFNLWVRKILWRRARQLTPVFFPGESPWTEEPSRLDSSSVQLLSRMWLSATPWTAEHQASLFIMNSQSLLKLMSIESVMPSNHLILCCPLLLLDSIFPSIRVFSNESALRIRWPKYWSFTFSMSPSNEYSALISLGWPGWISLRSKGS